MLHIPKVLDATQVADFRKRLASAGWTDGRITAGYQSARAKNNLQLPQDDPVARELSATVRVALDVSPLFFAAALPRRVFPPLFNLYKEGNGFGDHVDNAVRFERNGQPVRTDLSATLFLSNPDEYDGGELVVGASSGTHRVKLPAGDMVLYGGGTVHRVEPVTRGVRLAAFFWVQSMVRDDARRAILFDLDSTLQQLVRTNADHDACVRLAGIYHNLLRQWADA